MSAAPPMTEPRNDMERLVQDLAASENVKFSVATGDGFMFINLEGPGREDTVCDCHQDLWMVRTPGSTLYARLGTTQRVRFIRQPDPHAPEHESLSVHLVSPGGTALRGHFTPLYDAQNQPLVAPFARWEELRTKYGGQDEMRVENGALCRH